VGEGGSRSEGSVHSTKTGSFDRRGGASTTEERRGSAMSQTLKGTYGGSLDRKEYQTLLNRRGKVSASGTCRVRSFIALGDWDNEEVCFDGDQQNVRHADAPVQTRDRQGLASLIQVGSEEERKRYFLQGPGIG